MNCESRRSLAIGTTNLWNWIQSNISYKLWNYVLIFHGGHTVNSWSSYLDRTPDMDREILLGIAYFCIINQSYVSSVRPTPIFWFRSDTKTETQIGRYCNRYQNHISKVVTNSIGNFFNHKRTPWTKFAAKY